MTATEGDDHGLASVFGFGPTRVVPFIEQTVVDDGGQQVRCAPMIPRRFGAAHLNEQRRCFEGWPVVRDLKREVEGFD